YRDEADRGREVVLPDGRRIVLGKTTTRPAPSRRGAVLLTPEVLARHFRARGPADVVGLHSTSPDNLSLSGGVDIDAQRPASPAPAVNLAAALAWYQQLRRLGFDPLLTDSNGAGGYHLLIPLARAAPTPRVFAFLRRLTADHAAHGLPAPPEV